MIKKCVETRNKMRSYAKERRRKADKISSNVKLRHSKVKERLSYAIKGVITRKEDLFTRKRALIKAS